MCILLLINFFQRLFNLFSSITTLYISKYLNEIMIYYIFIINSDIRFTK